MNKFLACLPLLTMLLATPAIATNAPAATTSKSASASRAATPRETESVTHGSVTVDGKAIKYTATAGTILLYNDKNEPTGNMFYVAYTQDGANAKTRPLTFIYNGGPGSSSVWLEMGSFGPVRVAVSDAQATPPPPYDIVPNQYSLLDKSDLVFIDMIGSGYSRVVGVGKGTDFWGVDQDVASFGQFIQRYLTKNNRWDSPKYLLGESYGTTRSANLADWLQGQGVALNGIVLQSTILNYGDTMAGTDLEYIGFLPSYAAIAWYHNKLPNKPADLPAFLQQVRAFARGEYAAALYQGSSLPQAEYNDVLAKLQQYTGLSAEFLKNTNFKFSASQFRAELLRDQGKTLGRYDARYEGTNTDNVQATPEYDPSDTGIGPAYTSAWNWYVRNTLKYDSNETYRMTGYAVIGPWDWHHRLPGFQAFAREAPLPDVAANLGDAMRKNPHLKVFSANGYYDLATPFFKTEFDLDQLNLPPAIYKNISFHYYPSGHMLYLHVPTLAQYKSDLAKWYDATDK